MDLPLFAAAAADADAILAEMAALRGPFPRRPFAAGLHAAAHPPALLADEGDEAAAADGAAGWVRQARDRRRHEALAARLGTKDPAFVDFVDQLLALDPGASSVTGF